MNIKSLMSLKRGKITDFLSEKRKKRRYFHHFNIFFVSNSWCIEKNAYLCLLNISKRLNYYNKEEHNYGKQKNAEEKYQPDL